MSITIPLFPLWVVRSVQSLNACTRVHFTLYCDDGRRIIVTSATNVAIRLSSSQGTQHTSCSHKVKRIQNISVFIKKRSNKMQQCIKILLFHIYMKLDMFRATHRPSSGAQKTALAASGVSYVKGCWTCRWWTLSGTLCLTTSTIYMSNSLSCMKNQRLPVQFFRLLTMGGVSPET